MVRVDRYSMGWHPGTATAFVQLILDGGAVVQLSVNGAAELAAVAAILATKQTYLRDDGTLVTIWV